MQKFGFNYVFEKNNKKSKEDAVLLSNWNINFQVTTTLRILSYVPLEDSSS